MRQLVNETSASMWLITYEDYNNESHLKSVSNDSNTLGKCHRIGQQRDLTDYKYETLLLRDWVMYLLHKPLKPEERLVCSSFWVL